MRTFDPEVVKEAVKLYAEEIVGLNVEEWLSNPLNIALVNEKGDVSLLEHQVALTNTVCAHYFFKSRGKEAIKTGKEFMAEVFNNTYVEVITGLTPCNHKAALWMNRQLGLKEYGVVNTEIGPCKFAVITKQQWKDSFK